MPELPIENLTQLGRQRAGFIEPDVVYIELHGRPDAVEGAQLNAYAEKFAAPRGRFFFLVDLSDLETLPAETRKVAVEGMQTFPVFGTAAFGASLAARVVVKLMMTAMNMLRGQSVNPVAFRANPAECLAWIEQRRNEVAPQAPLRAIENP